MTDLTIHAGVTWRIRWPIIDTDGESIDLDGFTASAQIRPSPGADELYHDFGAVDGGISFEAEGLVLTLPASISKVFDWRTGAYDVHLHSPDGDVFLVDEGAVQLRPAVTVDA